MLRLEEAVLGLEAAVLDRRRSRRDGREAVHRLAAGTLCRLEVRLRLEAHVAGLEVDVRCVAAWTQRLTTKPRLLEVTVRGQEEMTA